MTLQAYQRTAATVLSDRQREHQTLAQITGDLMHAGEAGDATALNVALHRNRELWNIFVLCCSDEANRLPEELRARIVGLGLWVREYTSRVMRGEKPHTALVDVNREIMDGLIRHAPAA